MVLADPEAEVLRENVDEEGLAPGPSEAGVLHALQTLAAGPQRGELYRPEVFGADPQVEAICVAVIEEAD
jgi:hypothetical protein